MKPSNKLITALLLSSGAAAGIAAINKYIKVSAVSKNLLQQPNPHCYRWRFGNIYYTKEGTGKPLLLLHDLNYFSSGCEWESLIPTLKKHYTVYTVDLLGCGRSEKPNLTYTNFLYVQLLSDFIQSEIGRRTSVIATGASAPLVIMTCGYRSDLFDQLHTTVVFQILGILLKHKICQKRQYPDWIENFFDNLKTESFLCRDIQDIIRDIHYSHGYICREFKKNVGKTMVQCLNESRVAYSTLLLMDNSLSVLDIAMRLNYNSQSAFINAFKKVYRVSPNQWRIRVFEANRS